MIPFAEIPYDEIPPHSLIVVRGGEMDTCSAIDFMKDKLPTATFVQMAPHTEILVMSEIQLNAAGWFKDGGSLRVDVRA